MLRFTFCFIGIALSACGATEDGSAPDEAPVDEIEEVVPLELEQCRGASQRSCSRAVNCTATYGWDAMGEYHYAGCSTGEPASCELEQVCATPTEGYPCLGFDTSCIPDGWFKMPCTGSCPKPPAE